MWQLAARAREAAGEVQQLFRELLPAACGHQSKREQGAGQKVLRGGTCRMNRSKEKAAMAERRPLSEGLSGPRGAPKP